MIFTFYLFLFPFFFLGCIEVLCVGLGHGGLAPELVVLLPLLLQLRGALGRVLVDAGAGQVQVRDRGLSKHRGYNCIGGVAVLQSKACLPSGPSI